MGTGLAAGPVHFLPDSVVHSRSWAPLALIGRQSDSTSCWITGPVLCFLQNKRTSSFHKLSSYKISCLFYKRISDQLEMFCLQHVPKSSELAVLKQEGQIEEVL